MGFFNYFWDILPTLLAGVQVTLLMTVISMIVALVLAILLALGKMYGTSAVRWLCSGYIEFFRGTPLLAQLFIVYYGLPVAGLNFDSFTAAVITFGLNSGAYQAEYLRGAIQSIEAGQVQAARSVGMSFVQAMRKIVLPQAFRRVIPPWGNDVIYNLKYTSVAFMIGAHELTSQAKIIAGRNFRFTESFMAAGIIYLILVYIFSRSLGVMEKRLKIPGFEMRE